MPLFACWGCKLQETQTIAPSPKRRNDRLCTSSHGHLRSVRNARCRQEPCYKSQVWRQVPLPDTSRRVARADPKFRVNGARVPQVTRSFNLLKVNTPVLWTLGWVDRSASGVHRSARPFCRRCAPGLNWPGRASGAVTLKKLECSKQAYALDTLAWDNIIGF
ncbi:hypothetical protein G2W53_044862 [Senna tora]|uniref:Uncharacterized protein n=1 Tax=Senna tora TaxID=362788 RepID=A0A834VX60_9FABA|nr:hypothetical protein G2W53_044862 [Senna tora]